MHSWMSKILATSVGLALSLGLFIPSQPVAAAADTTLIVTEYQPFAPTGDGVWYRDFLVLKTRNKIKLVDQFDDELLTFTIPTLASSDFAGADRVGFDTSTGRLFYGTGYSPMKLWYLDVDLLIDNFNDSEFLSTIQPVQIFQGLGVECTYNTGGIAFRPASSPRPEELYFGCPHGGDVSKNKLYKISIPASGDPLPTATMVSNGSYTYSFVDLEYRSQDDSLFAVMRRAAYGQSSYIAKIRLGGPLPVSPVTLLTSTVVSPGLRGITGIDIDASGSIFYTTYENTTTSFAGYQITQEAPVAVSEGLYKYLTTTTDYIYSHDLIMVAGSQAGVIGYQTNGHGGLVKITGTPASSASTIPYAVIFNSNFGTSVSTTQEASTATTLTPNPFIRPGYSFMGWNEDSLGNSTPFVDGASYSFNANLTLYAQWSLNTYNLTFDLQDGSAVTATTFDVENSVPAPSAPTRNGYTFAGWATTPTGSALTFPYSPAAADLTLYAKWSPIVYNLTFDSQGGSPVAPSIFDVANPVIAPSAPTRNGYTLLGWATTPSGTALTFPYTATAGNLTLYAQWSLNTYNGGLTQTWTKIQSNGKRVKMYAKDPVGDGKIQFFVDGKEIAWVNAVDKSDPKLSFASGYPYLVRSVTLHEGKNRFEIKLDGVRIWRATYAPRG
jgi:uncharacterized repeat protein (TIGR02543 family)